MNKTVVLEIANMEGRYGIENYLMNMLRNFDLDKVQINFLSYAQGPFDEEIRSYGCEIFRITPLGASLKKIRKHNQELIMLFKNHPEIQVVHIHGNTAIGCIDARIAKKMGIKKIIVHSHSDGCNGLRSFMLHIMGRIICSRGITHKVSCSKAASKWMFGNENEAKVLKNAIDLEKYRYDENKGNDIKLKLGLSGKKVIGHVGRVEKPKNHAFILEVFNQVHKLHPETNLLLIGDGGLGVELDRKIKEMGLEDAVIRIKQCDCVNEMLQAMDVFLFPSIWEGLGISLIEAQASGLKCIVSDIIKEEVCVTDLIEKHALLEGAETWADCVWSVLDKGRISERDSTEYIKKLCDAGYSQKEAAGILQEIYIK